MFPRKQLAMIPAAFATAIVALLVAIGHVPAPEYASTSVVKDGIAFADTPVEPFYYASTQVPTFGDTMIIEDPEGVAVVDPATGDIDYTSPTLRGKIRGFTLQTSGVLRNDQMLPFTTTASTGREVGVLFIAAFAVEPVAAGVITNGTTEGAGIYVPTDGYVGAATIKLNGTFNGEPVSGSLAVTVNAALPPQVTLTITPGTPIPKPLVTTRLPELPRETVDTTYDRTRPPYNEPKK